jgi:hypothetical protein
MAISRWMLNSVTNQIHSQRTNRKLNNILIFKYLEYFQPIDHSDYLCFLVHSFSWLFWWTNYWKCSPDIKLGCEAVIFIYFLSSWWLLVYR